MPKGLRGVTASIIASGSLLQNCIGKRHLARQTTRRHNLFTSFSTAMLLTDPALEQADARVHLVAPYRIWDWVAATDTEPCFIVSTSNQTNRPELFTTAFVSSVERLLQYAGAHQNRGCQVFLLQKELNAHGQKNLRFDEIMGIGVYQGLPTGIPYFAHLMRDGSYQQTYDAQPTLVDGTPIEMVASFSDEVILQAA